MQLLIKGILLAILGIGIGSLLAWGFFRFQVANSKENFFDGQWAPKPEEVVEQTATKLTVDGLNPRDLGVIRVGSQTSVDFLLRNPTSRKLKFQMPGPPPGSLAVDLPSGLVEIAGSGTYPITVTVTPTSPDPKFSKSILVQTEDGARTVLTLAAQVEPGLELLTPELVFSRSQLATEDSQEAILLCATADSLQLKQVLLDGRADLPSWLKLEPANMEAERLGTYSTAQSGLILKLTVGPELPSDLKEVAIELVTDQPQYVPQRVRLKFGD